MASSSSSALSSPDLAMSSPSPSSSSSSSSPVSPSMHLQSFFTSDQQQRPHLSALLLDSSADTGNRTKGTSPPRAHFRTREIMKMEGRRAGHHVWICEAAPRSPLPEAHLERTTSEQSDSSQSSTSPTEAAESSALYLGVRPTLIHSSTVPDVRDGDQSNDAKSQSSSPSSATREATARRQKRSESSSQHAHSRSQSKNGNEPCYFSHAPHSPSC